jgi:hypothetical protein
MVSQEHIMATANFDTIEGDDIDIDADDVVSISRGEEEGTCVIELEDGTEVTVAATQLEVAAELGLNPLDFVDPEDDDESLEDLVEEESDSDD